jgi:septal ring factor EnvC (AmiA/AmiB activator)
MRGIVKGGLVGLGLSTAALFWVFGGRAVDLIQSKADKGREWARTHMTSFEDELDMTKKQVEKLGPAIGDGAEALVKLEESVKDSVAEVAAKEQSVASLKRTIGVLHARLGDQSVLRVSDSTNDPARSVKLKLAKAIDGCKQAERTLVYAKDALSYREAQVKEARARLEEMKATRATLISKISEIEARRKAREAARQFNEFTIDTSPLAEAQKAVESLDRRESRDARAEEIKSELADDAPLTEEDDLNRDLLQEAETILNSSSKVTSNHDA